MQTPIQVFCKGNQSSLRKKIANDGLLNQYNLYVVEHKNFYRSSGWLKIKGDGTNGALNIEWDGKTKILWTRVVNKGQGKPNRLAGDFVSYLLGRHSKIVKAIHIASID
jgi:hypothetical protein